MSQREPPRKGRVLRAVCQEAATRVEPRLEENVPCNRDIAGAFLLHFCAGSF